MALQFSQHPIYKDDDQIINDAFKTIDHEINHWHGVQISKQFITKFEKTKKEMDAAEFSKIAKNHQDTTSWKISGNKFFAPYIAQARQVKYMRICIHIMILVCCIHIQFLHGYCQCITNVDENIRSEVFELACIAYAVSLFTKTIRFHRTAQKPLIRHKTVVMSTGVHTELENLYSSLKVRRFIDYARKERKRKENKS